MRCNLYNSISAVVFIKLSFQIFKCNPLILTAAKTSLRILKKSCRQKHSEEIFDGEMSIRKIPTTLPQIFCKMIINCKDIVKSIIDPDDNFWRTCGIQ